MKVAKFTQFIWNPNTPDEYPTGEDVMFILKHFMKAVHERGLVCGGGIINQAEEEE